jgi:hypothetical protein
MVPSAVEAVPNSATVRVVPCEDQNLFWFLLLWVANMCPVQRGGLRIATASLRTSRQRLPWSNRVSRSDETHVETLSLPSRDF